MQWHSPSAVAKAVDRSKATVWLWARSGRVVSRRVACGAALLILCDAYGMPVDPPEGRCVKARRRS